MKCQILFSIKSMKNITNLSSAELAQRIWRLSKHVWYRCSVFYLSICPSTFWFGFVLLMGKFLSELSARHTIMAGYYCFMFLFTSAGLGGSVGCASDWRPGGCGFNPRRGRQHSSVEIDHEIFSTVILRIWIKLVWIKFTLLQCECNNSVNTNLIWINLMQIKLIWINLVYSLNATWCGSTWSGSTWLLVWMRFDPDQLDPN